MRGEKHIMGNYCVHDHVRIIADNEWFGLIGIVRDISDGFMQISCIRRPSDVYIVNETNIEDIELFVSQKGA